MYYCDGKKVFISLFAVQICELSYIHLYSSPSTGILRTHKVASSQWLDSSVGRALHRYRRGHGFESRLFRPEFFSGLNHIFNSLPSVPNLLTLDLVHNRKFHSCFQSWQPSFTSETFASLKTSLFHILVIRAWSTIHKFYL